MESQNTPIAKLILSKKNKAGDIIVLNSTLYYNTRLSKKSAIHRNKYKNYSLVHLIDRYAKLTMNQDIYQALGQQRTYPSFS